MDTYNINISFTGDLNISGAFKSKVIHNQNCFCPNLKDELQKNDYVVCNLEGPTTDIDLEFDTPNLIKSPKETIAYLARQNIKVFNLANNHIFDANSQGMDETIQMIEKNNGLYFGIKHHKNRGIQILTKNGIKIGLIGLAHTFPSASGAYAIPEKKLNDIKSTVNYLATKTDHVVVNFHGLEEFTLFPSPVKRNFLRKIAKLKNVSVIIAHHSHTFQGYEFIDDTPIFYSLGNFIFDIPNHKIYEYTDFGAILKFQFKKNCFSFDFIPFSIKNGELKATNYDVFMKHFYTISNFKAYKVKWRKEAHRVLFRKNNPKIAPQTKGETLQNSRLFKLLFSKKFYQKCKMIVSDQTMLSIYSQAIYQEILYKLLSQKKSD